LLAHSHDHVRGTHRDGGRLHPEGQDAGRLCLLRRDVAAALHQPERHGAPCQRALGVRIGIPVDWCLDQSCQQGGLVQGEILHVLPKVGLCSGSDAIGQVAVVCVVQIDGEDVVLGVAPREFSSQDGLLDLALQRALICKEQVLHHLLGNGTSAKDSLPGLEVLPESPSGGQRTHAGVGEERRVLSSHSGLDDHGWDLLVRDDGAPPARRVEELEQQCPVPIVDTGALERLSALVELIRRRQRARIVGVNT